MCDPHGSPIPTRFSCLSKSQFHHEIKFPQEYTKQIVIRNAPYTHLRILYVNMNFRIDRFFLSRLRNTQSVTYPLINKDTNHKLYIVSTFFFASLYVQYLFSFLCFPYVISFPNYIFSKRTYETKSRNATSVRVLVAEKLRRRNPFDDV